jgi:HEAT repeat protein
MNRAIILSLIVGCLALLFGWCCPNVIRADQPSDLRKQLKDPSPTVRKQAGLALAGANDAEAVPILIDLLAELPAKERIAVEEFLSKLAGEGAPAGQLASEDRIAGKTRRDAWMAWWRKNDGPALLAIVRAHTLTPELRRKIEELIGKLGDDDFSIREAATKRLFDLGRTTLPQLRQASKDRDPETARRARQLIERLEQQSSRRLPAAVVRLLALRKPPGATEALLAYLPRAEEDNRSDEIKNALSLLALRDGKLDAALIQALSDDLPERRASAAEALVQGGGKPGRQAARKLLDDGTATVRLRAALALAQAGDKDGVPVLIDLLAALPDEHVGQAEEALFQLAGDTAPPMMLGTTAGERGKCRDAWAAWWKANAAHADMTRFAVPPLLGYTLLCDTGKGRVFEIDRHGKECWSIENLQLPTDAVVVPGNRVLIAEWQANRVSERDFKGKILWQKQVNHPIAVQLLGNGHIFIASDGGPLREIDRTGKDIYVIQNLPKGVRAAYRSPKGPIVYLTGSGECVLADKTGKRLKSFATHHVPTDVRTIDVAANGRILVTQQKENKVVEYDAAGNKILELNAPQAATAASLPSGNFLVTSYQSQRVYELNRRGKIIWEHKGAGHVYGARRR